MFLLPISSVGVSLFVCAGSYLKCMLIIIFVFYIIDDGVGPEILNIKMSFICLTMGWEVRALDLPTYTQCWCPFICMCRQIFEVYVIIFIFFIIDNGVGPEILIKNEFNFFNWGLGVPSFGLTHT